MSGRHSIAFLSLSCLLVAAGALAAPVTPRFLGGAEIVVGGPVTPEKAAGDTVLVMGPTGSGAPYLGDFESGWNGWTSVDNTAPTENHWYVSDHGQAVPGELGAWCGELSFASCTGLDPVGGYGNNWHQILAYRVSVANPAVAATVRLEGYLDHDVEPGYDLIKLQMLGGNDAVYTTVRQWTGTAKVVVSDTLTYLPGEFAGGTDVAIAFTMTSDGGWSDEDCQWNSAAACRLDDLSVVVEQAGQPDLNSFTDFQDGTFGDWAPEFPVGVGDFAKRWFFLEDLDYCRSNYSVQVAFIDDGLVVPGTGGSFCINWCYGPAGYIVNTTGGLAGPAAHLDNAVVSPVMAWPDDAKSGFTLAYDAYEHEDLSFDSPGIFHVWRVRSADTDGSAGHGVQVLADQPWVDLNFLIMPDGARYQRYTWDLTYALVPGRDEVQVQLGAIEYGWAFGWAGDDGYPAPYFDNVRIGVYAQQGPVLQASEQDLAQDGFPEADLIDAGNLAGMHVRFDMARNISPQAHLRNDPGDSLLVTVAPARSGAVLAGAPTLHYVIAANPLFDPYRTTATSGAVAGVPADGLPPTSAQLWAFDLPDTGTLFPGDVMHYYFRAADDVGGDVQAATLPADLAGFGVFGDDPLAWDTRFVVRALPSLRVVGAGALDQPGVLFWNDVGARTGPEAWVETLAQMNLDCGVHYDLYHTNAASSNVGNGLGGRTAGPSIARYDVILYTCGDLFGEVLETGERNPGSDIQLLRTWLDGFTKTVLPPPAWGVFMAGDNLASSVAASGPDGAAFVSDILGVSVATSEVRPFINNQVVPEVVPTIGNPVIQGLDRWVAYGGCLNVNTFDAVVADAGAARLAEFTDPAGQPGAYGFAAASEKILGSQVFAISLPYDLSFVYTDPNTVNPNGATDRLMLMRDIGWRLNFYFEPGDIPDAAGRVFAVAPSPNPFNPATKLSYTVRHPGRLVMKVYDIRGRLVRTLIDRQVAEDGFVMWDGTDGAGGQVASGVYFVEARMGTEVKINKVALVK